MEEHEKIRAKEVNDLFDAVVFRVKIREYEIFRRAYEMKGLGIEEMREVFGKFLFNVATCPQFVVDFCEMLLEEKHKSELARQNTNDPNRP